ncbi:MAG: RNHCP domain-containing protein [Synergistaceae bacterium]|nr:RNHCP domain-containing protein [Synergistaceae bacterium]
MNRENKRRKFNHENYKTATCMEGFTCKVCGWKVNPPLYGERHRNHCSNCLSSLHLDNEPGDRKANCGGIMEPIGIWVRKNGEWSIIHRCRVCGHLNLNHVAPDDNPAKLLSIAMKPIACPPFPIEYVRELEGTLAN